MISVIVPVYNVEKYLDTCVQSILGQTYKDFELILVDDGSTDHSGDICDRFSEINSKIKVIHKKNGGLSDARNTGIAAAIGTRVTFVDSDDYVSPDYLEALHTLREKYDADIVVTGIKVVQENDDRKVHLSEGEIYCYTGKEALQNMLYQKSLDTSACALLIPKEYAIVFPFPYGKYHEDDYTTWQYYLRAEKVVVTTKPQYYYLQRSNSIMHTWGQASIDQLDAADNLVDVCIKFCPELVSAALSKKFSNYCQVYLSFEDIEKTHEVFYMRIRNFLMDVRGQIARDKMVRTKNRIAAIVLLFGMKALKIVNKLYEKFM